MKRLTIPTIIGTLAILFGGPAIAQQGYGSAYDWRSGNSYTWSPRYDGGTTLRGFNSRSGSNWSTQIEPDGDMRGFDQDGNYWSYDRGTGMYQNFGTGRTCYGTGAARICY